MLSKTQIQFIRSLSQKKGREEHSMFVVEGEKMVDEAIRSGFEIVDIYKRDVIGEDIMSRISSLNSPSPVLAVVKMPQGRDIIFPSNNTLSLALDSVRDPGNLGTIIRVADWFGIEAIYASKDCVDLYNPKVIQSTMGALFRSKIYYVDLFDLLSGLDGDIPVYGTFLDGDSIYSGVKKANGVIVMGSESHGISKKIEECVSKKILIPPYPSDSNGSESLNVAIATAIVCSEFRRVSASQTQTL